MKNSLRFFSLFLFVVFFSPSLQAQWVTFQKSFSVPGMHCDGYSLTATSDGGYLVSGSVYDGLYDSDIMLVKLNYAGDTMWTRIYGDSLGENAVAAVEYGGGYRVFGNAYNYGNGSTDMMILELDAQGDTIKTRTYGGPGDDFCIGGSAFQQTVEGDLVFIGQTNSYGAGLYDMMITRVDVSGNIIWSKTYGGVNSEQQSTLCLTSDGGFAGFGLTTSFGAGGVDFYLVKTDSLGNLLWSKSYGTGNDELGFGLIQTSDHGFLMSGLIQYSSGAEDLIVIKADSLGNMQWSKRYIGPDPEWGFSSLQTADGDYVITGKTQSFGNGNEDFLLLKIDPNGDTIWTKAYGLNYNDFAYSVIQTPDGGYMLCGHGPASTVYDEMYIVKTDANGNSGCDQHAVPFTYSIPPIQVGVPLTLTGNGCTMDYSSPRKSSGCNVTTRCYTVGIAENNLNADFEIYPNPSSGIFNLNWKTDEVKNAELDIYNSTGQKIIHEDDFNESQINMSGFSPGIYFLIIQIGEEIVKRKIVVE